MTSMLNIPWPATTPDIDLLEHIYDVMKKRMLSSTGRSRNPQEIYVPFSAVIGGGCLISSRLIPSEVDTHYTNMIGFI